MFTTSHVVRNEATHELFLGATVVLRSRDQAQAFRRFLSRYSLESNPGRAIYGLEFRDFIEDNAMIKAEAALDTFWNVANAHWRRTVGTTPFTLVQQNIEQYASAAT
jgi:hypothetical protein